MSNPAQPRRFQFTVLARGRRTIIFGAVLIVLALATVISSVAQQLRLQDANRHLNMVVSCQARFNKAVASNVVVRSNFTSQDRAATTQLITQIFTPAAIGATSAQRTAKILHDYAVYQSKEAAITKALSGHPYPPLSAASCG